MVMRRPRLWMLAAAATVMLGGPAPVGATPITRGTRAPELDARDITTNRNVVLGALRGRMVLLEYFGTACPHCQGMVPRLNSIHDRYRARGLVVLGLTPDSRDKTLRFRRAYEVRHALATAPMDTLREYGVKEYPLGFLISPDGRVLWRGRMERLTDRVLNVYLQRVKILPSAPPAFTLVRDALRTQRFGEAESSLERLRSCAGIDDASCRFVLGTLDWITWHKERAFTRAREDERRGRWHMAFESYAELEISYAGSDTAAGAAEAKARLLSDATRAREIRSGAALTQARRLGRWQPVSRQRELLRPIVAEFPGTAAAREAARLLRTR